jgi:hypothetical protein
MGISFMTLSSSYIVSTQPHSGSLCLLMRLSIVCPTTPQTSKGGARWGITCALMHAWTRLPKWAMELAIVIIHVMKVLSDWLSEWVIEHTWHKDINFVECLGCIQFQMIIAAPSRIVHVTYYRYILSYPATYTSPVVCLKNSSCKVTMYSKQTRRSWWKNAYWIIRLVRDIGSSGWSSGW